MQFNFRNLLVAGAAIFTLTACNNSDNDVFKSEESNLEVLIRLPQPEAMSRAITDEATINDFKAKHVYAYLLKGQTVIETVKAEHNGATLTAKFPTVSLDGTEKVLVKVNGKEKNADLKVAIKDIQPTETEGKLENIVYTGIEKIEGKSKVKEGINHYEVAMDVQSIAARVEIKGKTKFNDKLVKSMKVKMVAPLKVNSVYGTPEFENIENGHLLWSNIDGIPSEKVVANHLFAGDVPSITMGFEIEKFEFLEFNNIAQKIDGNFIYKLDNGKYGIIDGAANPESATNFIEYGLGENNSVIKLEKTTGKIKVEKKVEYFTLTNFAKAKVYEGGKIYLIELDKNLIWNAGDPNFENSYNPEVNEGTDTPKVQEQSIVNVTATVKEWTKENTNVSIN